MLDEARQLLLKQGALKDELPPVLANLIKVIPNEALPDRLKAVMALSEVSTFAAQFRRNIWHWEGFELPVNSVAVAVAGSGEGKDSSVKALRRTFATSYELIDNKRKSQAKMKAIAAAEADGEADASSYEVYRDYYNEPAPIYIAPTTPQGFIQHINDISDLTIGAGTTYSGEFGDELASNPNMLEVLKTIAETYDTGDKEVVYTKGKEFRSKEIVATPISALLISSPKYIVYDEATKRKFLMVFGTKLARRCFFTYTSNSISPYVGLSLDERIAREENAKAQAIIQREALAPDLTKIAQYNLAKGNQLLQVHEDLFRLFTVYKLYNEAVGATIDSKYPLSRLVREHLQWKALKLAGAFAILKCHDTVEIEDYIDAINTCELLDADMAVFEAELVKEPYEAFASYMQNIATTGKSELGLHDLRKMKYIPMTGNPIQKMKELVHLAAAYDNEAVYSVDGDKIRYEKIIKTDVLSISYVPIDNTEIFDVIEKGNDKVALSKAKERVSYTVANGLSTGSTTFEDLGAMLKEDYAYSPFVFKDGIRSKDGIIGGTKWLVLDIDDSCVTAEEAHFMLQDINHHIALSSNKDNHFKFRVIIELDSVIEVNSIVWRHFYTSVAEHLSLKVDVLAQSAIFYSYSGRDVLSTIDAEPLPVRDFIMQANDRAQDSTPLAEKRVTNPQKAAMLADPLTTFSYAFEAANGAGSRSLIRAAYHAKDLDLDKEGIIDLIHQINNYWTYPLDEERLEKTIITQIMRW